MLNIIKVKVEPLDPTIFVPFGQIIWTFEEAKSDVAVGALTENAYTVKATPSDLTTEPLKLSAGQHRAHFACHSDAGQSFYPSQHSPSVFLVGAIQEDIQAEELRAFYIAGDVGVCLHLGVWHTMPICVDGDDVYQTTRGD